MEPRSQPADVSSITRSAASATKSSCVATSTAAPIDRGVPQGVDHDNRIRLVLERGRLVGEQHSRLDDHRPRKCGPLLLTHRDLVNGSIGELEHAQSPHQVRYSRRVDPGAQSVTFSLIDSSADNAIT